MGKRIGQCGVRECVCNFRIRWLGEASLRRWHLSKHMKEVRGQVQSEVRLVQGASGLERREPAGREGAETGFQGLVGH